MYFVPSKLSGLAKKCVLVQMPLISEWVCVLTVTTDFKTSLQLREGVGGGGEIKCHTSFSVGLGQS